MTMQRMVLGMAAVMVLGAGLGCSDVKYRTVVQWHYEFFNDKDNTRAILQMDGVVIVFEDQPRNSSSRGEATVSGQIETSRSVGAGPGVFTNGYDPITGVNTMNYGGRTFMITEGGGKLEVGSQQFDLSAGAVTVIIKKDGTARIGPQGAGDASVDEPAYKKLMGGA